MRIYYLCDCCHIFIDLIYIQYILELFDKFVCNVYKIKETLHGA